jgi:hypothetical protein
VLRFAADENFHNIIVRGLRQRQPALDIVRVQDIDGLAGADDPAVLAWAAQEDRVILTHDLATMPHFAYMRVASGQPMRGVFAINREFLLGPVIDELLVIAECSSQEEWTDQVRYFPIL